MASSSTPATHDSKDFREMVKEVDNILFPDGSRTCVVTSKLVNIAFFVRQLYDAILTGRAKFTSYSISEDDCYVVLALIKAVPYLRYLNLGWGFIEDSFVYELAPLLENHTALTSLDLGYNRITAETLPKLTSSLKLNNSLAHLNLACMKLRKPEHVQYLIDFVKEVPIPSLTLSKAGNSATFLESLETNTSLVRLNISIFQKNTSIALEKTLRKNTTLRMLRVEIYIERADSEEFVLNILELMKQNSTLAHLTLYGDIHLHDTSTLAALIESNTTLTHLIVEWLQNRDVTQISQALEKNFTLRLLNLNPSATKDKSIQQSLKRNENIFQAKTCTLVDLLLSSSAFVQCCSQNKREI